MTLRDVLTELTTQQKLAANERDVLWRDYFQSRRVVVVPDAPAVSTEQWMIVKPNPHYRPEEEVLKILRGALAQPNIGAARPMIKSAIERLKGGTK